jgi:tRNA threonylcarbamoyl adenosine modification protein (Sua5/YciO/YrdC/YwlC family)
VDSKTPLILKVDGPDLDVLQPVLDALRGGRLVVLPTETVYGLAADPRLEAAVDALYRAKQRPDDKPVALLASGIEPFEQAGVRFSPGARRLAGRYWPGPLTMVLPGPGEAVGCRIPDHPVTLALLSAYGHPLAVTSANRSGEPAAVTAAEALDALGSEVAVVVDSGASMGKVPSTVVEVRGDELKVLREGAISTRAVMAFWSDGVTG